METITQIKKNIRKNKAQNIEIWKMKNGDGKTFLTIYDTLTGKYQDYILQDQGQDGEPCETETRYGCNGYKRQRLFEESLVEAEN